MDGSGKPGRPNQRRRTRNDLLKAASRLLREGRKPSLEEVAEAALVSRATAYRYFPSVDALLVEGALDVEAPDPKTLFEGATGDDPLQRLQRVDLALNAMMAANEVPLRMMLAHSMQRRIGGGEDGDIPVRQNRRTPLIDAALAPARHQFKPAARRLLGRALALVIGTESMLVFKDVLQLRDDEAREVRHWMIRALVDAARTAPRD